MTIAEVFRDAVTCLRLDGWCQHALTKHGSHCVIGALRAAADGPLTYVDGHPACQLFVQAHNLLQELLHVDRLADWNDAPGRTLEDVVTALDAARILAEETARQPVGAHTRRYD